MIRLPSAADIEARAARNRAAWPKSPKVEVVSLADIFGDVAKQTPLQSFLAANPISVWNAFPLPYPPSTNTYWRNIGPGRTILSAKARAYRKAVQALVSLPTPLESRLIVTVELYPPDKRRRDLDNVTKALFDSLQHAGVYLDDSQIDEFTVKRMQVVKGGRCEVFIREV